MAEFATIARPYANALFELADEKHQAESWLGALKELAWIVQQPSISALLDNTSDTVEHKANFLLNLLSDSQVAKSVVFRNFVNVVAEAKRFFALPEIYAQFQNLFLSNNHTKHAVIYSAFEFASEGQKAKLLADLERHFNTRLDATFKVAPELIGGIKVEVEDQVLDLSVRNKLNKLYAAMIN
ncbi:F-type ATPase subunit delta [Kingella potus]|uniref:ATP synthase subunit delta n=1 Tax=Kingella potus TaxID=265175 RepID=A0A377R255_9NEIS|nr:F0F1 ATP synthase subunit delta [Kingella potus]UOP00639.1 F0F1 ATP synthase subunit delta [Kingella potus]STR02970.1 F-type ATPase subunit delta [Kingella potus]